MCDSQPIAVNFKIGRPARYQTPNVKLPTSYTEIQLVKCVVTYYAGMKINLAHVIAENICHNIFTMTLPGCSFRKHECQQNIWHVGPAEKKQMCNLIYYVLNSDPSGMYLYYNFDNMSDINQYP